MRDIEARMERRPLRALDAMVRPQDLLTIGKLDRLKRLFAGMRAGKRGVSARMPVLGQDDMREFAGQPVDHGNDLVALRNGKRAARTEIILHVDDNQYISIAPFHCPPRSRGMISLAMIST